MTRQPSEPLELPELAAAGLLAAAAGGAGVLWLVSGLGTLVTGHGWHPARGHDLPAVVARVPSHLTDLPGAYPSPTRQMLPPTAVLWTLLLVILGLMLTLLFAGLRLASGWAHADRGRSIDRRRQLGMATRADLRRHLSAKAVRSRARQTRPSLTGTQYPTTAVGLPLGRDVQHHREVWGSVEDSYLYLGPPRSGKGVHLVIPQALSAPGALIVTSTRPDVLHATHAVRAARGDVLVFDPQGLAPDVPTLRWNPTRGCTDPLVAINRARALAAGTGLGDVREGAFWQQMTSAVLRCYLHAAALSGRPIGDLLAWAARPEDPTPVRILRNTAGACGGWAEELASQAGADAKQRDTVWSGVRRAVDSLADPRVVAACSPPDGAGFDPTRFLTEGATLYLLGATGVQLSVAPLITALLEDVLDTARERAAHSPHGRLDPPVLLLLDEAANIAPIPSLPNLLADGGGVGITTVAVLQSLAQARNRWSESAADSMVDAATTKVVLGGLAHATDLANISRLAGEVDVPLHTRSSSSTGTSHSTTTQRLPVLPIDKIRTLPAGRALVLARRCAPVEVQLQPYWKHPQYRAASRNDPSLGVLRRAARRMFRVAAAPGSAGEPTTNETLPSQNATTEGIEPCS
jgi:type IV secretion system protein VirD4